MGKTGKTISVIVAVIVVGTLIQFGRYHSKVKTLQEGQCGVLPMNYFPFNGTFCMTTGKLKKA